MAYFYLILTVFFNASLSVFGKFYNRKNADAQNSTSPYNLLLLLSIVVGWGILYAFKFSFDAAVLPYSIGFAASYTVCFLGLTSALKYGPASLTSLFFGLSLLVTTIWGFFFWGSKVTVIVIIGLVLVVLSVWFCLTDGKKDDKKISLKWLIFMILAFFGNAGCSIIQRTQQMNFGGQHGVMAMFFASILSLIAFLIIFFAGDRTGAKTIIKKSWYFPVSAGLCNVALNFFVILLASSEISPSLIYPTIGVGGLIVVITFSLFVFKEKLRVIQWIGVALGIAATVLLSL